MVDQLLKFKDLLHVANLFWDILRAIGYGALVIIGNAVDFISGGAREVFQLINFFEYGPVKKLISDYQPVFYALGSLAFAYFGLQLIINRKLDRDKVLNNLVLAFTILFLLPWGMSEFSALTSGGVKSLSEGKSTASTEVFKANITDLYKVDKNGWKTANVQNDIKEKIDVELLDITEKVDTSGWFFSESPLSDDGKKLLEKKLVKVGDEYEEGKMKSFWKLGDPAYYRYDWHPFLMAIELITKGIVYAFVIYKSARLMNEVGLLYVVTMGISLTDIKDGQRNKQLVTKIRDTFIVMFFMVLLINFFDLWSAFVASSKISSWVKPIAVAAGAGMVIDGPNFIEQMFGYDAGLSSVGRSVIALSQGVIAGKSMTQGAKSAIQSMPSKFAGATRRAARIGGYTGGAIKGALDGFKSKTPEGNSPLPPEGGKETKGGGGKDSPPTTPPNASEPGSNNPSGGDRSLPGGSPGQQPTDQNVPENKAAKEMQKPLPPLANLGDQADKNKAELEKLGVSPTKPLSDVSSASKARKALEGHPQHPPVPNVSGNQLPKNVQDAKNNLLKDQAPRPIDTESLGDKAVNLYADTAKRLATGETATRTRKVYDVSKATTKRIDSKFRD